MIDGEEDTIWVGDGGGRKKFKLAIQVSVWTRYISVTVSTAPPRGHLAMFINVHFTNNKLATRMFLFRGNILKFVILIKLYKQ